MRKTPFALVALTLAMSLCIVGSIGVALLAPPVHAQSVPASNASYAYISTATTTIVRGNAGFLNTVMINGGTAGVVTLFDIGSAGCRGTPASGNFATIETIGATNPVSLIYNLQTKNGICVVTAAATDLTVTFN
jgi:hypothetical protein